MTQIPQEIIDQLREQFLGKRIIVHGDGGRFVGVCNFLGHNEFFPSWGLQVTLDRMPVTNVEIKKIELLPKSRKI
jgi:hypothetical protein